MSAQHTPGPWGVNGLAAGGRVNFTAPNGQAVPLAHIVQAGAKPLAACVENLADARLIAAAPDLLAALEKAQEYFDGYSTRDAVKRAIAAAIAKATGEETNA
jgi:hypothetical protein